MLTALLLYGNLTGFGSTVTPPPPVAQGGGGGWGHVSLDIGRRRKRGDVLSDHLRAAIYPPDVVAEVVAEPVKAAREVREQPVIDPANIAGLQLAFDNISEHVIRLSKKARKRQDEEAIAILLLMQ